VRKSGRCSPTTAILVKKVKLTPHGGAVCCKGVNKRHRKFEKNYAWNTEKGGGINHPGSTEGGG